MKQGCVLAPVLFILFFTCILNHALHDTTHGVYLKYRLDGSLFDLRRLNARTRILEIHHGGLVYWWLWSHDTLGAWASNHGKQVYQSPSPICLAISLQKTEVMHQPAAGLTATPPSMNTDGIQLKSVNHFKYLGSVMSSDGSLDSEVEAEISKASQLLGCLCSCVMSHRNKLTTKIKVYRAEVLTSLL